MFSEHFLQNTIEILKIELALLDFGSKSTLRLTTTIEKTLERCIEFWKKIHIVHNKCQTSSVAKIKEFPDKDQHLKDLQDRLQEDEQIIQKIEGIIEEVVKKWIKQASVSNFLLEDLYRVTPPKMAEIESQLL